MLGYRIAVVAAAAAAVSACSISNKQPAESPPTATEVAPATGAALGMQSLPHAQAPYGFRKVEGPGWWVFVPRSWEQVAAPEPIDAAFRSREIDEAGLAFNVTAVPYEGDRQEFVNRAVLSTTRGGARVVRHRELRIGGLPATAILYTAQRPARELYGIGRVLANDNLAVAVMCHSSKKRFETARATCDSILDSVRLDGSGAAPRSADAKTRLLQGGGWSFAMPEGWNQLPHKPPVAIVATSGSDADEAIAVTALSSEGGAYRGTAATFADEYLSTEQANKSFEVVAKRSLKSAGEVATDFEYARKMEREPIQLAQVYLARGNLGLIMSCGGPADTVANHFETCQMIFESAFLK